MSDVLTHLPPARGTVSASAPRLGGGRRLRRLATWRCPRRCRPAWSRRRAAGGHALPRRPARPSGRWPWPFRAMRCIWASSACAAWSPPRRHMPAAAMPELLAPLSCVSGWRSALADLAVVALGAALLQPQDALLIGARHAVHPPDRAAARLAGAGRRSRTARGRAAAASGRWRSWPCSACAARSQPDLAAACYLRRLGAGGAGVLDGVAARPGPAPRRTCRRAAPCCAGVPRWRWSPSPTRPSSAPICWWSAGAWVLPPPATTTWPARSWWPALLFANASGQIALARLPGLAREPHRLRAALSADARHLLGLAVPIALGLA